MDKSIQDNTINNNNEPIALQNKGTGAGGKNTNYYGKLFEEKTKKVMIFF